jgi:hypothetical protein
MAATSPKMPVVMYFQPTDYRTFSTPEELKEWERRLKDAVGFRADFSNLSGTCTACVCGEFGDDDCDQD